MRKNPCGLDWSHRTEATEMEKKILGSVPSLWYTPTIPALRRLRQEDCEFEASLSSTVRPCLKRVNEVLFSHLTNEAGPWLIRKWD